jgi:hypothetical protein
MASEEELRKINVRSPYFVNVTKPVSEGGVEDDDTGGGEEPFVEPTEPTVTTTTISCGDTRNIGFGIGINRYEFSTLGKQIGDYDINFSNIKMPFYAKIGIKGNMPSEYTFMVGHSAYDSNWLAAVGTPVPSSTTISSHPDGNDQTITYTSTQPDIDTYGETVLLEVFHPVINIENIQFTADCPNPVVSVAEDSGQNVVVIMSIYNNNVDPSYDAPIPNKLNGVDADWLTLPEEGTAVSYVFGVYTPDLAPFYLDTKHAPSADYPVWNSPDHTVVYRPADSLNNNTNVFEMNQFTGQDNTYNGNYQVIFSSHAIELWTGDTRVSDEAFVTRSAGTYVIGNKSLVSRLGVESFRQGGALISNLNNSTNKQTFTVNRLGTIGSNQFNHLESGSHRLQQSWLNGLQIMNQAFELASFPETEEFTY